MEYYKGVKIPKQRADGRFLKIVKTYNPVTGDEGKKWVYGKTKKEFAYAVLAAEAEYQNAKNIEVSHQIGPWMERQLARKLSQKRPIKPNTYLCYDNAVKNHIVPYYGADRQIETIRKMDIEALYQHVIDSGKTSIIGDIRAMLVYAFADAIDNEVISKNPVTNAQIPAFSQKARRALTRDEEERFIIAVTGQWQEIAYYLALYAGLRVGEVCGLQWGSINIEEKEISVEQQLKREKLKNTDKKSKLRLDEGGKSINARRKVPINTKLLQALLRHHHQQTLDLGRTPRSDEYVIINYAGNPQEPTKVSRRMADICLRAEIPKVCYHELRHTFATRMAEKGATKPQIAAMLGQETTNVSVTEGYLHIDTLLLRDFIE